jgi:NTP pyrophosphatase (non-canonical NTP hydrolase)
MSFITEFTRVQKQVNKTNQVKGFNEPDSRATTEEQQHARFGLKIALIGSELSEALEAVRKDIKQDSHIPEFTGVEAELADAVIRIMNLAADTGARLAEAIVAKAAYNASRPYKHGGKKF